MDLHTSEYTIFVPWGRLSVVCYGEKTKTPVLMLHGNLDSAATFFPLIKEFPDDFRIMMIDLPGCGTSSPFPSGMPLNILDFIPSIKIALDYFGWDKFMFVGHSMGFSLGLLYDKIYPDHITRMVSLDNIGYMSIESKNFPLLYKHTHEEFFDPANYKKFNSGVENSPVYTYHQALNLVIESRKLTDFAAMQVLSRNLLEVGDDQYKLTWDQRLKRTAPMLLSKSYQVEIFGKTKVPHLVILATESVQSRMAHVGLHVVDSYLSSNPDFRVAMLRGNHDNHLNNPKDVAKLVVPFLQGNDYSKKKSDELVARLRKECLRWFAAQKYPVRTKKRWLEAVKRCGKLCIRYMKRFDAGGISPKRATNQVLGKLRHYASVLKRFCFRK